MSLGPYATFIVTSYTLAAVVVLILIAWIALDYRSQKERLRELEAGGHRAPLRPRRGGSLMSEPVAETAPRTRRWLVALPLMGFAALAALFLMRLYGDDPSKIPSALIGRPAPQTSLPPLEGLKREGAQVPGLDPAVFKGKVSVVNVWASWCVPCHDEAPLLTELGKDTRLQMVGINYKDAPDNARRFPRPLRAIRSASSASTATVAPRSNGASTACPRPSWSGAGGTIVYKLVGPVTSANFDRVLKVEIEKALK